MLKKIAVALVAATMLTAPALAQGGSAPQATMQGRASAATTVAKPSAKTHRAVHPTHKRVKHIRHGKYAKAHARKHVAPARHRASAKHARHLKPTQQLAPRKSNA